MYRFFLIVILLNLKVLGQEYSNAIEDNSFFIEEAYNQDPRVVQHIFNAYRFPGKDENTSMSFTQEWPVGGETNQLSYSIPFMTNSLNSGVGDILINYRYQLLGEKDFLYMAPRLSVIFPTGNKDKNFGMGKMGLQVSLPFSKRISEDFALHFNAGYTVYPGVSNGDTKAALNTFNTGGSVVWLANYNYNFFVEYLLFYFNEFNGTGGTDYTTQQIINPGVRFAIDINNLQIVPGVSFPFRIDENGNKLGFFFYLSFEHQF
jgi:hypothetical protein